MAAVIQTADEVEATVEGARRALAIAISKANLTGDPLGIALDALSQSLGAQLALHKSGKDHLAAVTEGLDHAVSVSLATAERELAGKEAAVVGKIAPQLVAATDRSIQGRLWTIKFRTMASIAAVALLVGAGCLGEGYFIGLTSGRVEGGRTADAIVSGANRDGPAAAAIWASLIKDNDVQPSMAACMKAVRRQDGRRACLLPVWLDPPPPPDPSPHT